LVGLDELSRRAVATAVLPNARWVSCALTSPADLTALPSGEANCCQSSVILTSAEFPEAERVILATLSKYSVVVVLTPREDSVPAKLRRAGRLDSVVALKPPPLHTRLTAWRLIMSSICDSDNREEIVSELASASPAFGLADFRATVYNAHMKSVDGNVDPLELLAIVRSTRPSLAQGLDFVSYGLSHANDGVSLSEMWSDVGGYDNVKKLFSRLVEWPLTHSQAFGRLGVDPPRGVLLHGPSGCGKTLLTEAFLSRLVYANWIRVDGTTLFSRYLGESEARIRSLFAKARALEPCIVFIDNIEAVGGSRDGEESGVERRVLGALLSELDGTSAARVFVLGCTEHVQSIDAALLRNGRIDNLIEVGLPSFDDRREILSVLIQNMRVDFTVDADAAASSSLDLRRSLAERTSGFTGAGLSRLCREAVMCAMREVSEPESVRWQHFEKALQFLSS
jgi:SpoVK/Ycf46/Vps4 family AAA+-type ATPase